MFGDADLEAVEKAAETNPEEYRRAVRAQLVASVEETLAEMQAAGASLADIAEWHVTQIDLTVAFIRNVVGLTAKE